jgi:hypothetical protein
MMLMRRSLTFDLSWRHPAVLFVLAVVVLGGAAIVVESIVPVGINGAAKRRGGIYFFLTFLGLAVWARILLHMLAVPQDYLPDRTLTLDPPVYERREFLVRTLAYGLGVVWMIFALYKIVLLMPNL